MGSEMCIRDRPDVLAAVARARLATARDADEAGTRMGTGLAELRRAHGG